MFVKIHWPISIINIYIFNILSSGAPVPKKFLAELTTFNNNKMQRRKMQQWKMQQRKMQQGKIQQWKM